MTFSYLAALLPLNRILGFIAVVVVFGGLIFFHELGHFLVARIFRMGVKAFSLGFGPPIVSKTVGKTKYQVAALPLGGYVSLVGEQQGQEIPPPFTEKESFALRPAWQRFFVIAAGSVFNLILAWLLCWAILAAYGNPVLLPQVGSVLKDSPAEAAGLQQGDSIIAVNGRPVDQWVSMYNAIQASKGALLKLEVERESLVRVVTAQPQRMTVTEAAGEENEIWGIGVTPSGASRNEPAPGLAAAGEGFYKARDMVVLTWKAFVGLVTRQVSFDSVGGPILIGRAIYEQATTRGLADVLFLAAFISVNLGVMNLLPIPVLDGGHLFFLLIEMIVRRPVPKKIQETSMFIGLALLLLLMVFATVNDIARLFTAGAA